MRPVAWSPDGKWVASFDESDHGPPCFGLWDAATGTEVHRLTGLAGDDPGEPVFSPDGKQFAAVVGGDGLIHMWDVETGKDLSLVGEHKGEVCAVGFSRDGREVLTGSRTGPSACGTPKRGPCGVGSRRGRAPTEPMRRVALRGSRDGNCVRVSRCGRDGFPLSDLPLGYGVGGKARYSGRTSVRSLERGNHVGRQDACNLVAECGAQLWDVGTGKRGSLVATGTSLGAELAFSPDGKTLAAVNPLVSPSGEPLTGISLWDMASGKRGRQWTRDLGIVGSGLLFSPDGRTVAMNQVREVDRWDAASGKELAALPVPKGAPSAEALTCLACSADGQTWAAGGATGDVYLWEMATAKLRGVQKGHRSWITSLDFSPDGAQLISGSVDTTALVWDLTGLADNKEAEKLTPERLAALWDDLADADAGKAYRAGWRLASDPEASVPFLSKRLRPAEVDAGAVAKALAALDSNDFDEREAASRRLAALGDLVGPALRTALEGKPSDEARRRLEELLHRLDGPVEAPDQARALRCVEVLERVGSEEARRLLDDLAGGARGSALTRDAKAALVRLAKTSSRRDDGGR